MLLFVFTSVAHIKSTYSKWIVNGSMCAIGPSELEGYVTDRTYSDRRAPDACLCAQRRAVSLSPRKERARVVRTEFKKLQPKCGLIPATRTRSHEH